MRKTYQTNAIWTFITFSLSLMIEVTYQKLMFISDQQLTLSCPILWDVIYLESANLEVIDIKVQLTLFVLKDLNDWRCSSSFFLVYCNYFPHVNWFYVTSKSKQFRLFLSNLKIKTFFNLHCWNDLNNLTQTTFLTITNDSLLIISYVNLWKIPSLIF